MEVITLRLNDRYQIVALLIVFERAIFKQITALL